MNAKQWYQRRVAITAGDCEYMPIKILNFNFISKFILLFFMFTMQTQSIFSINSEAAKFVLRSSNIKVTDNSKSHQGISKSFYLDTENDISKNLICLSCNVTLLDREDQIYHYKSDLHRLNIKRKLKNLNPISEQQFEEFICSHSSLSSISGSESDDEPSLDESCIDELILDVSNLDGLFCESNLENRILPKSFKTTSMISEDFININSNEIYLQKIMQDNSDGEYIKNNKFDLLEDIYHNRLYIIPHYFVNNKMDCQVDIVKNIVNFLKNEKWAILMGSAGHFAATVFLRDEMIQHKTFHRYVIRAKRGSSQGKFDSHGKNARSAGAALRRHNEKALLQDIICLVKSWADELNNCAKIFLRAPAQIRKAIFSAQDQNHKIIIERFDWRLSLVPVPTRRPTLKEVLRIHQVLSSIAYYDCDYETYLRDLSNECGTLKGLDNLVELKENLTNNDQNLKSNAVTIDTKDNKNSKDKLIENEIKTKIIEDSSPDISETEMALSWHMVEFDTNQLKEFALTKKPRRRRRKPKNGSRKKIEDDRDVNSDLTQRFIAFCKRGVEDVTLLDHLLKHTKSNSDLNSDSHNADNLHDQFTENLNVKDNHLLNENEFHLNYLMNNNRISEARELNCTLNHSNLRLEDDENNTSADFRVQLSNKEDNQLQDVSSENYKLKMKRECECEFLCKLNDGETFLHIASNNGQSDVVAWLLDNGADPTIKNRNNQTAYQLVTDKHVRNQFRKFRFLHPDKYDYTLAKIPEPLTDEMLNLRRQKNSEKKKIKRAKTKVEKEVAQMEILEKQNKNDFLNLSDDQKIKSLKNRNDGQQKPVLRCFKCGQSLSESVPFEYHEFRFCSIVCLKAHKLLNQ